jgi:hypothetical protein
VLPGIKRDACAALVYDVSREPIVCPSCGANYVPDVPPMAAEAGIRAARLTGKTGWPGRSFELPDPEPDVAPEVASTEDANEKALSTALGDDVVLEEEPDEATDVSGLVEHHESDDPRER